MFDWIRLLKLKFKQYMCKHDIYETFRHIKGKKSFYYTSICKRCEKSMETFVPQDEYGGPDLKVRGFPKEPAHPVSVGRLTSKEPVQQTQPRYEPLKWGVKTMLYSNDPNRPNIPHEGDVYSDSDMVKTLCRNRACGHVYMSDNYKLEIKCPKCGRTENQYQTDLPLTTYKLVDLEPHSISIVSRCPYCGTKDWDTPKKKPNGEVCNHPTKFSNVTDYSEKMKPFTQLDKVSGIKIKEDEIAQVSSSDVTVE